MIETETDDKKRITIKEKLKKINNIVVGETLINLAYSSIIIIYFIFFNIIYTSIPAEMLIQYINISSFVFLGISIIIIENAYKNSNYNSWIHGAEFLVVAIFTLLIRHIPKLMGIDVQMYILVGTYSFAIYYILKSAILYTIEKQQELKKYSDIKEIVKDEPIKKASKRKNTKKEEVE